MAENKSVAFEMVKLGPSEPTTWKFDMLSGKTTKNTGPEGKACRSPGFLCCLFFFLLSSEELKLRIFSFSHCLFLNPDFVVTSCSPNVLLVCWFGNTLQIHLPHLPTFTSIRQVSIGYFYPAAWGNMNTVLTHAVHLYLNVWVSHVWHEKNELTAEYYVDT